ncbi:MAG: UDP-2,3-diacylglucosamine diphosphatase [Xanthomonadales bacterium]|nr:UDP-2,3-diacylglucosamine diphosphatase [Xanthomonadales bacterium]
MSTLFISDLHLDASRPQATAAIARFLERLPGTCRRLYILGDLFESWIGDDDDAPLPDQVAGLLRQRAEAGLAIAFMAGNRDFALGPDYAKRAGFRLLEDPTAIDLHGRKTLLMHGDTLCTDDTAYQAFRVQVRDPAWLANMLAQPLAARRAFAAQARASSREHTAATAETIMDVNANAVADAFRQHQVDLIIHGHTHRPAVHEHMVDGRRCTRIVLGDWYEQGTVLVAGDDGSLHLDTVAIDTAMA